MPWSANFRSDGRRQQDSLLLSPPIIILQGCSPDWTTLESHHGCKFSLQAVSVKKLTQICVLLSGVLLSSVLDSKSDLWSMSSPFELLLFQWKGALFIEKRWFWLLRSPMSVFHAVSHEKRLYTWTKCRFFKARRKLKIDAMQIPCKTFMRKSKNKQ